MFMVAMGNRYHKLKAVEVHHRMKLASCFSLPELLNQDYSLSLNDRDGKSKGGKEVVKVTFTETILVRE